MNILDSASTSLNSEISELLKGENEHKHEMSIVSLTLDSMTALTVSEDNQKLAGISKPGARASTELKQYPNFIYPFPYDWEDFREFRQWAHSVLQDQPTFAADASYLYPVKNKSEPIAYIQASKIENLHARSLRYTKSVNGLILSGEDLLIETEGVKLSIQNVVHWKRFSAAIEQLISYMKQHAETHPKPVCFYGAPLILTFIQYMRPEIQKMYTNLIKELLQTSEVTQVPLIAHLGESHSTDLVHMACHMNDLQIFTAFSDSKIIIDRNLNWGDRTRSHICARRDKVEDYYYEEVGFLYIQLDIVDSVTRLEFPKWMIEAGILENVLDIFRAEYIIGDGAPNIIEAAFALSTVTLEKKSLFHAITEQLAAEID